MLFSVEQAFVGREEIRAPLKTPAWEASVDHVDHNYLLYQSVDYDDCLVQFSSKYVLKEGSARLF